MIRCAMMGCAMLVAGVASAADLPSSKPPPPAPSAACLDRTSLVNDVFGFNAGSDVNDAQQLSLSGTYGGSFGIRGGRLASHSGNLQATYSPLPCFEVDPFFFTGVANSKTFGVKANGASVGGGVELKYKLLGREVHGVGLTFDMVLQGQSTSGAFYTLVGPSRSAYDAVFSIFADKELIAGKLYGALNASYDWNFQDFGAPRSGYANTSIGRVGAALTYQLIDGVFVGVEASHFRRYDNLAFGRQLGEATFVGPNFYWSFAKGWALSGAWNAQVAGRARDIAGNLDLTNFARHLAKLKLNHDF